MRFVYLTLFIAMFSNTFSMAQETKKSTAKAAPTLCPRACQRQIDNLNGEVASLKQAITALLPASQSWNTNAVNDANKGTLLSFTVSGQGGIYAITLKQLTNVGGTGVTLAVNPPVQLFLADGGATKLKIPTIFDQGTHLSAGGCDWTVKLNGNTLIIDPSACMYPKGYGAALTIQSAR
jgi:hypothetical protein